MTGFPDTNYALIGRVQDSGDGPSWIEFLGIYQPVVYRMARRRGLQDADAEDVMQQVFASISRSIEGWTPAPGQPPFRAWLTTIARNAIHTALTRQPRDRASGSTSVADLLKQQPHDEDADQELLAETRLEIVRWAAEQIRTEFTPATWEVFWKIAMEGESVASVSQASGRSTGAIYVARHRVLSRLKEKIAEVSQHWDN